MRRQSERRSFGLWWLLLQAVVIIGWSDAVFASAVNPDQWYSHGFHVDGHALAADQYEQVYDTLGTQLQIVESVGLPNAVLTFFRTVPIVVDPTLKDQPGAYGRLNGERVIRVQPIALPGDKPIVLHELLHAYHDQVLTLDNAEILGAYRLARASGMYPLQFKTAHFMDNEKEYFAVIGSIYLFGRIHQPPFTCDVPRTYQPEFLEFLAKQFGYHDCKIGQ